MRKTLVTTFSLIAIAAVINLLFYFYTNRGGREVLEISQVFSFFCAIPVIAGFVVSNLLTKSRNLFLRIVDTLFLIGNGILLISSVIIIIIGASFSPIALLTSLYIGIGFFVYIQTIGTRKKHLKEDDFTFSDSDVLDDDFIING